MPHGGRRLRLSAEDQGQRHGRVPRHSWRHHWRASDGREHALLLCHGGSEGEPPAASAQVEEPARMRPKIVRTVAALRRATAKWRSEGLSYAVVPTMGALHEGHLKLVRKGLRRADRVIATIFVNPRQFAAHRGL